LKAVLKVLLLVLLALLAVYYFYPEAVDRLVTEVSSPSEKPEET
jgi:hypothetical protein